MKKMFLFIWVVIFCLTAADLGWAGELKIGYISLSTIFQEYNKVTDSNKKLDVVKNDLKKLIDDVRDLGKNYDQLSEKGKEEREKQIKAKEEGIIKRRDELRNEEDRILREILKDIENATREIRQKEKWTYIIDDRLIIDGPEDMDVTNEVVKLLNTSYKGK
ncbi:MAG: OmpH family outer membrane protein [Candidatus Omnitrophota bacterium]